MGRLVALVRDGSETMANQAARLVGTLPPALLHDHIQAMAEAVETCRNRVWEVGLAPFSSLEGTGRAPCAACHWQPNLCAAPVYEALPPELARPLARRLLAARSRCGKSRLLTPFRDVEGLRRQLSIDDIQVFASPGLALGRLDKQGMIGLAVVPFVQSLVAGFDRLDTESRAELVIIVSLHSPEATRQHCGLLLRCLRELALLAAPGQTTLLESIAFVPTEELKPSIEPLIQALFGSDKGAQVLVADAPLALPARPRSFLTTLGLGGYRTWRTASCGCPTWPWLCVPAPGKS
jgi:hypothetical protein